MKKPKFIKAHNLPPRGLLLTPVVWWMFLDRLKASDWVFGVIGTLLAISFAIDLWRVFAGEAVDIVGNDKQG